MKTKSRSKAQPGPAVLERIAEGKALRSLLPRSAHGAWAPPPGRADPIKVLELSSQGRIPELVPIRYGRMMESAFTFMRGSPSVMARDLALQTPVTGLRVQASGDCHLENFGVFATPERNLIFDINDFDETLPAPWEWDVKRLATSFYVVGRTKNFSETTCADAAGAAVAGYRTRMAACAGMSTLEIWYSRIDAKSLVGELQKAQLSRTSLDPNRAAPDHTHEMVANHFTQGTGEERRFIEQSPTISHLPEDNDLVQDGRKVLKRYHSSLRDDLAHLFARYHLIDLAMKVVGLGSVGTRCVVALFNALGDDPLILQIKEAKESILEPYAGKSSYKTHGERIVAGQFLMQAASDIFLGWTTSEDAHQYYVRQLADMKASLSIKSMNLRDLGTYASLCGEVLAIAHARSGDPQMISGYLGSSTTFDKALTRFAARYADQITSDYELFVRSVRSGRLPAVQDV